jgi:F420H(2)-dependent quinone reductase
MAEHTGDERRGVNPPKWILKTMSRTHIFLNKLSLGKMFNTLAGDEVCFVTMTGAKSGRTITMPLMYVPYGDGLLLVASMGGGRQKPGVVLQHREESRYFREVSRQGNEAEGAAGNSDREAGAVATV